MANLQMEFHEYCNIVKESLKKNRSLRRGQAHFNILYINRPDLSEQVRGGFLDPFYRDENLKAFLRWVEDQW